MSANRKRAPKALKITLTAIVLLLIVCAAVWFVPVLRLYPVRWLFEDKERNFVSQNIDTSDLVISRDIAYIDDGDRGHLLDVYRPAGAADDIPVMVNIHGGGLVASYKEVNMKYCYEWARRGYAVVNISYRRLPETTLWHQIDDCMAAIRYIDAHRGELSLDLDECYLSGDSAGALLSLFTASINSSDKLREDFGIEGSSIRFRALGLISIMLETDRRDFMDFITSLISDESDKDTAYRPYLFDPSALVYEAQLPPVFLVTGDGDFIQSETIKLDGILTGVQLKHELKNYPKGTAHTLDHIFAVKHPEWEESQEVISLMSGFFESAE